MARAYRTVFDRGLTRVDPERAHELGFRAIRAAGRARGTRTALDRGLGAWAGTRDGRPVETMGLRFPNVLGLAAGFDKDARGPDALAALGFGHVEVGTVTGLAQPGNPRPRLFRLPEDRAVVNRMGFNNEGAAAVADRLARRAARVRLDDTETAPLVLGVNIGKSKVVPEDDQAAVEDDHVRSTRLLAPYADYLVVNVSSPNTPGLRSLQATDRLEPLLRRVRAVADEVRDRDGAARLPLLVKVAPDLADDDLLAVADLVPAIGLDGVVATNTTVGRAGLRTDPRTVADVGAGGLSGPPLGERALQVVTLLRGRLGPGPTLIGVGGITTVSDARARLAAGADLLQAYSAFVYEGPLWPRRILRGVAR